MITSLGRKRVLALSMLVAAGGAAGCSEEGVMDVPGGLASQAAVVIPTPVQQQSQVCASGPAGTYNFTAAETDPLNINTINATTSFSLQADQCVLLATTTSGGFGLNATTNVTFVSGPTGVTLVDVDRTDYLFASLSDPSPTSSTSTHTGPTVGATLGLELASLLVFNFTQGPPPPPPPGGEGCTPGYWKQTQHFGNWTAPYTPSTLFSAVFEDAFPGMTLLQVLEQGGGGLKALGRHTVAALLNGASADVDADMTAQQVIDAFNAVFPGGDYTTLHNQLAGFNEQGCPLARAEG